jgi:hypothetical protein
MEIRIASDSDDMNLASCMLVDGRILRLDIYDHTRQRSLEGVMVHVETPAGMELNIIGLFKARFEDAWSGASPSGFPKRLLWYLRKGWQWWLFAVLTVASFLVEKNVVALSILASAAATFLVNAAVDSWTSLRRWFRGVLLSR